MKRKITESQIRSIVAESLRRTLNEMSSNRVIKEYDDNEWYDPREDYIEYYESDNPIRINLIEIGQMVFTDEITLENFLDDLYLAMGDGDHYENDCEDLVIKSWGYYETNHNDSEEDYTEESVDEVMEALDSAYDIMSKKYGIPYVDKFYKLLKQRIAEEI